MYINKKNSTHTNKTKSGITENIYIYIHNTEKSTGNKGKEKVN